MKRRRESWRKTKGMGKGEGQGKGVGVDCSCSVVSGVPCRCAAKWSFVSSFVSDLACGEADRTLEALLRAVPADFTHELLLRAVPAFAEVALKEDTPTEVLSALCVWADKAVVDHLYLLPERTCIPFVDSLRTLLMRTKAVPARAALIRTFGQLMAKSKGLAPFTVEDYHSILCHLLDEDVGLQQCVVSVLPSLSKSYPEFCASDDSLALSHVLQHANDESLIVSVLELYLVRSDANHMPSEEDVPRFIQLLSYPSNRIQSLSVGVLAEIIRFGDGVAIIKESNLLQVLAPLMQRGAPCVDGIIALFRRGLRIYSNDFIQLLIDASLIPILLDLLIQREDLVLPMIVQISCHATENQLRHITENGLVSHLCDLLQRTPSLFKYIHVILRRLLNLGRREVDFAGYSYSTYQMAMEDCYLPDILKSLKIYSLDNFFK